MNARTHLRLVHDADASGVPTESSAGQIGPIPEVEPVDRSPSPALTLPEAAVGSAGESSGPIRPGRKGIGTVATVVLSLTLHAAALAMMVTIVVRQGMEAPTDAVSVQIVEIPAPPSPTPDAAGNGGPSANDAAAADPEAKPAETAKIEPADTPPPKTAVRQTPDAKHRHPPQPHETDAAPPTTAPVPDKPSSAAATAKAPPVTVPQTSWPVELTTPPVIATPPRETLTSAPLPPQDTTAAEAPAAPALPETDVPRPTRRPQAQPKPDRPTTPTVTQSEPAPPKTQRGKAARSVSARSTGSTAHASISAGERNAYFRRLLSHVQRYKTYPDAARSAGLTGAARLSITIDRSGRLVKAAITRGSGHAILDDEARSVARKAAPYPAPPDGIGSSTFTFAVTLRFSLGQ